MSEHTLVISGGRMKFVYDDELVELFVIGDPAVCRVSDVEPTPDGKWTADMAKSGAPGVVLGPFETRAEALAAERAWLTEHKGL